MSSNDHRPRAWVVVVLVAMLGAHLAVLHHVASRFALPAVATSGLVLLVAARHLGVFAALHQRFRRRP